MEKTRFDLVPFESIGEIADVLGIGARKYSANNWCRGTEWSRYFAALCRHIFAWWRGEDNDPETGKSHLAHAGCCLLFLMEYQRNKWGTDDRFTGPDGEIFTKNDGLKISTVTPEEAAEIITNEGRDMLMYEEIKKANPIDLGLDWDN